MKSSGDLVGRLTAWCLSIWRAARRRPYLLVLAPSIAAVLVAGALVARAAPSGATTPQATSASSAPPHAANVATGQGPAASPGHSGTGGTANAGSGDGGAGTAPSVLSYDAFIRLLARGGVRSVVVSPSVLSVTGTDGHRYTVGAVPDPQLVERLLAAHVQVWGQPAPAPSGAGAAWLFSGVAVLVGLGVILLLRRRTAGGSASAANQASALSDRTYRPVDPHQSNVRLADVAGLERVKREVEDVVEFLREPEVFRRMGARPPKGILLEGPPGTGKTLLARALAGEANARFFQAAAAEFNEIYVGVGPRRIRQLFAEARASAPSIVFIDELDALGSRAAQHTHNEDVKLITQLLSEMDGFTPLSGVVVVGATNRADALDHALLRPGRFDRIVTVDLPSREERRLILDLHARGKPFAPGVDPLAWAAATAGFAGADLENLLNEAVIQAIRNGRSAVERPDLVEAFQRTVAGLRSERRLDPGERRLVAYHEAGHAVCGWHGSGDAGLQYVSILPRGQSGGQTVTLPSEHAVQSLAECEDRLATLLGGRAAEMLVFGTPSTGAAADLVEATRLARQMVGAWGMGARLAVRDPSESNSEAEVEEMLQRAQTRALACLQANRGQLERLVAALLERDTLEAAEIVQVLEPAGVPGPVCAR